MTEAATANVTFVTVHEVAAMMDVSEQMVTKWARDGMYGAFKHGRDYFFPQERLDMLNVDEVAAWLGVNVQTVRRWARTKMYPTVRIGRRYYFTRNTLIDRSRQ